MDVHPFNRCTSCESAYQEVYEESHCAKCGEGPYSSMHTDSEPMLFTETDRTVKIPTASLTTLYDELLKQEARMLNTFSEYKQLAAMFTRAAMIESQKDKTNG